MKKVAIVGFGFMGKTHYGAWKKCPRAKVVAVCDSNLSQLAAKVVGNIKGAADNSKLPKSVRVWEDFDAMLAAGGFDIVDLTLPTPLHAPMVLKALKAGYHVLCEKPMALTLKESDAMLAAAKASKRCFLVAHCLRFFPEYAALREFVKDGRYGKVIAADFTRFITAPKWSPKGGGWLLDESKSGGPYVDTHIHDVDYLVSLFGPPDKVSSRAHRSPHGYVDHLSTAYDFADGKIVTSDCSFAAAKALTFDAAARVFFERATVYIGGAYKNALTVYPEEGKPFSPKLGKRTGYEEEVRYFLGLVEGRRQERILTADEARESLRVILAERQSAATGRPVATAKPKRGSLLRKMAGLCLCLFATTAFAGGFEYKTQTDIAYADRPACRLDIRWPVGVTNFATVVNFHGGGLTRGKRHHTPWPSGKETSDAVAFVGASYDFLTSVPPDTCIDDAAAAVAWTLRNIAAYGGDPRKVFVTGISAGGYLTAMVGMDEKWLKPYGFKPSDLAGIAPMTGQMTKHFNVRAIGFKDKDPQYLPKIDDYAPLAFAARKGLPPACFLTGGRDVEWPCRVEENELLAASMRNLGYPKTEFHETEGPHGYCWPSASYLRDFVMKTCDAGGVGRFADGERVVFLGDSITHGDSYVSDLRLFQALRRPGSGARIFNCGVAGDTAGGASGRLAWEVLPLKPDRVFVMFGMNDIGRWSYRSNTTDAATLEKRETALARYDANLRTVVGTLSSNAVKTVLMTATPYDQYTRPDDPGENLRVANEGLTRAAGIVRGLASERTFGLVDLHAPLTEIQRTHVDTVFCGDRVHPNGVGHMLMFARLVDAMAYSPFVAEVEIGGKTQRWPTRNCQVTEIARRPDGGLAFTYAPKALPFPVTADYTTAEKFYPLTERLNRETFKIGDLADGEYDLRFDGRKVGTYTASELAAGINVATLETPNQIRARELLSVASRLHALTGRLRNLSVTLKKLHAAQVDVKDFEKVRTTLADWKAKGRLPGLHGKWADEYVAAYPEIPSLMAEAEDLYAQLDAVRPAVSRVTVVPRQIMPLPEHPRPDWERAEWLNLNGPWDFGFAKGTYDRKITVPFGWGSPLSGVKDEGDTGYYRRTVVLPKGWKSPRTFLVIGASDWETEIFINGKPQGVHRGGYTPFECDLTGLVTPGKPFVVEVRCWDEPSSTANDSFRLYGKQGYGNARGIWQTVYLEGRGRAYVESARMIPSVKESSVTAELTLDAPAKEPTVATVAVDGQTATVPFAVGERTKSVRIALKNPRLWSLDDPHLYDVTLSINSNNSTNPTIKQSDEVRTYFGLREIGTGRAPNGEKYVTLNGKPIYLQLCLDQSYDPKGWYTFPTDAAMKEEILLSKRLALSGNRVHIKVEVPRKLYWADKLGLLIMADVPNAWGPVTDKMFDEHRACFDGMLKRDFNHPAIFSWVLFNETWGLFSVTSTDGAKTTDQVSDATYARVRDIYRAAKAADPTRLVEDNSPCHRDHTESDLNSWHGYFAGFIWEDVIENACRQTFPGSAWNCARGYKQGDAPMLNSECGNVWGYKGSTGDIDWSWDYRIMMNGFRRHLKCAGWLYTQHHDVINEWTGYVRADRTMKETGYGDLFPGMTVADLHAPAYLPLDREGGRVFAPGATYEIPVDVSLVTGAFAGHAASLAYQMRYLDGCGKSVETPWRDVALKDAVLKSWQSGRLADVRVELPEGPACGTVNFALAVGGKTIARNFQCFVTKTDAPSVAPAASKWSAKEWTAMDGAKRCGTGSGYFEYAFDAPKGPAVFRAEVSTKRLNGKDAGDDLKFKSDMDLMVGGGSYDRSKNPNSYPMTSVHKYAGKVRVYANGTLVKTVALPDDPADSRGILSWLAQKRAPGRGEQSQTLDEAGSYGYLVEAEIPESALVADKGRLVIRLETDRTGLAVYGAGAGRYPFGPHLADR